MEDGDGTRRAPSAPYRADIDGLRAIAILSVLSFHTAPALVPGGYVGVDIFFVISGFLITRIIARQRDGHRFTFREFYRRRARRILPAYFAVAAVVAVAAAIILLPRDLTLFEGSLASSSLFMANVWFAHGFGYFQPASRGAPLLHLWSLAVEEQFYLAWPLLIAALSWPPIHRLRALLMAALALASLGLAAWMVGHQHATDAFYYLPGRAWEFLVGGLLAAGVVKAPGGRLAANGAALAGLALVAASLALLNTESPFPGLAALAPCLGAALLMWSGSGAAPLATGWLRSPPMVGLGRISYSLYLWHWPILVSARLISQQPLSPWLTLALVVLALGLAVLTWRFIEQPWRAGRARWSHLGFALAAAAVLFAVGAAGYLGKGWSGRMPPGLVVEETDINPLRLKCLLGPSRPAAIPPACVSGPRAARGDVLVWGDSHADALAPGVVAWAQARGLRTIQASRAGCPPLIATRVMIAERGENPGCAPFNAHILRVLATDPAIKVVILSARWPIYLNALPRIADFDPATRLEDANGARGQAYPLDRALDRTLDAIAATGSKARVVVVDPIPELPFSVPACTAQAKRFGLDPARCARAADAGTLARATPSIELIGKAMARHPDMRLIVPTRALCAATTCAAMLDGQLLYYDSDHMSATGARRLVPAWLDAALAPPIR